MSETNQEVLNAYATHQYNEEDSREIDKRILLAAAAKMKAALDSKGEDMKLYEESIRYNQRVWTMFQVALVEPDNNLPHDLKQHLMNISRYIDSTSFRIITHFTPRQLESLINLNRTIAAGLAKRPASQQPQQITIEQSTQTTTSVMISA